MATQQPQQPILISTAALIITNLIPLFGVLFLGWSSAEVLFLFWSESAVIGFFTVLKMIFVKGYIQRAGGKEVYIKGKSYAKFFLIPFFIFHYGIFMFAHLVFLTLFLIPSLNFGAIATILLGFFGFLASHGISFLTNYLGAKEYEKADARKLMITPYFRIFPMQFAIILGFMSGAPVLVLVLLKIPFDLLMHLVERSRFSTTPPKITFGPKIFRKAYR